MKMSSAELDRIVREVVRRLQQSNLAGATATASDPALLVVKDRVITAAVLQGRLQGVGRLQVRPDAIVTPLVRDLLKDQSVELLRANASGDGTRQDASYLLSEDASDSADSMLRRLPASEQTWQTVPDWETLLKQLLESPSHVAFLCSSRWAERLCDANQQGVRAVVASDVASVEEALQQTPVRLMIVNSRCHSETEKIEMASRFYALAHRRTEVAP